MAPVWDITYDYYLGIVWLHYNLYKNHYSWACLLEPVQGNFWKVLQCFFIQPNRKVKSCDVHVCNTGSCFLGCLHIFIIYYRSFITFIIYLVLLKHEILCSDEESAFIADSMSSLKGMCSKHDLMCIFLFAICSLAMREFLSGHCQDNVT